MENITHTIPTRGGGSMENQHWIEWNNTTTDYGLKCPCCGSLAIDCDGQYIKTPFCPFCGADLTDKDTECDKCEMHN